MKQADFEALTLEDVNERVAAEPDPQPGKPEYYDRPWTQLRDEMVASDAKTVGELPADRVPVFYHSTKSV